ncbi:MAG: TolC family protein [Prosthecobacter sp.]
MNRTLLRTAWTFIGLAGCTSSKTAMHDASVRHAAVAPPVAGNLSAKAGVEDMVGHALANNPEIAAADARVARMQAKVPQAKALPDPMAMVSLGNMAQTASGRVTAMTGLQQKLPLPGKRGTKARMAEEEVAAARAMREAKALSVASMVRNTYWDLYLAEQTARVLASSRTLIEAVQTAVEARLKTNQANQADLLQVTTEAAKLDEQIMLAKRDAEVARARLNTLMHRPANAPIPTARWQPGIEQLPAQPPLDDHPSMEQAAAKLRQFNAQLKLARLERFPDLTAGVQYAAVSNSGLSPVHNGQDQFYATLGVNIPLWQAPRQAAEDEARAGQRESEAGLASTRDDLAYQLSETRTRVETQKRLISLFDDRILADAKQAFEVSLAGYSSGKLPFVDLIERWRRWLGYEVQQSMNRAMLGKAVAAWTQAAGIPVTKDAN